MYECAVCRLGILLYTWSYLTSIVYNVDRWACFRYLIGALQSPEEHLSIGSNWGGGISVFMVEYIFLPWSCKILQAKFSTPLNWASSILNLILISIVCSTVLTRGACLSAPGLWNKYNCTCNKHPHLHAETSLQRPSQEEQPREACMNAGPGPAESQSHWGLLSQGKKVGKRMLCKHPREMLFSGGPLLAWTLSFLWDHSLLTPFLSINLGLSQESSVLQVWVDFGSLLAGTFYSLQVDHSPSRTHLKVNSFNRQFSCFAERGCKPWKSRLPV